LKMLVKQTYKRIDTFEPGHIGNLLFTLARFGVRPSDKFCKAVAEQVRTITPDINGRNAVDHIIWAFAKMGYNPGGDILDGLLAQWEMSRKDGNPQGFTTVLWALAVLGHKPDAGFLSRAMSSTSIQLSDFTSRSLANTLWAYAKSGVALEQGFLNDFFDAMEVSLPRFNARHLTRTLWACGEMKQCRGRFLEKLVEASRSKIQDFQRNQLQTNAKVCKQFGHGEGRKLFLSALFEKGNVEEEASNENA